MSTSKFNSFLGTYVVCNLHDNEFIQLNNSVVVTAYAIQYPKIYTAHKQEIHVYDVTTNEREMYRLEGLAEDATISCILASGDYAGNVALIVGKKLIGWWVGCEDSLVEASIHENDYIFSPVRHLTYYNFQFSRN